MLFNQNVIFYTLNGIFINTAFNNVDYNFAKYHAAISFGNGECTISANFGAKGFKYGIEDMLSNNYKDIYNEISDETVDSKIVFDLVHDYLLHSGFVGTLKAFENESSFQLMKQDDEESKDVVGDISNFKMGNTSFNMQRKNTMGPDMLPLSMRPKESERKIDPTAEPQNENEEVKQIIGTNQTNDQNQVSFVDLH
jgi:hypothetical protein